MKSALVLLPFYMILLALHPVCSSGETIDRVIAFIGDKAITERELERQHARDLVLSPERTRRETLEAMISTRLMLEDARRLNLWSKDDAELLKKYLDLKIRAAVFVSDREISDYYASNRDSLGNRGLSEVKAGIRTYLGELKFNQALKEHVSNLRSSAIIVVLDLSLSD